MWLHLEFAENAWQNIDPVRRTWTSQKARRREESGNFISCQVKLTFGEKSLTRNWNYKTAADSKPLKVGRNISGHLWYQPNFENGSCKGRLGTATISLGTFRTYLVTREIGFLIRKSQGSVKVFSCLCMATIQREQTIQKSAYRVVKWISRAWISYKHSNGKVSIIVLRAAVGSGFLPVFPQLTNNH